MRDISYLSESVGARDPLRQKVLSFPKVDLHRHLTGSISAENAIAVATRYGVGLPTLDPVALDSLLTIRARPGSLRDYFRPWHILNDLFISAEATKDLVSGVLDDASADNVAYLEMRMAPRSLVSESKLPLATFVSAVAEVVARRSAPVTRCILGLPRHSLATKSNSQLMSLFRTMLETILHHGRGCFIGVDLNGDENVCDGRAFQWFFDTARENGLHITIHAGELGSVENVHVAIENLSAARLGHGNAAMSHPELVAEIARRGIVLELCPTSNVLLGTIPKIAALPIYLMREMGIRYTINTDNPARCGITLSDELYNVARAFDMDFDDIANLSRTALEASFLKPSDKNLLLHALYGASPVAVPA